MASHNYTIQLSDDPDDVILVCTRRTLTPEEKVVLVEFFKAVRSKPKQRSVRIRPTNKVLRRRRK